MKSERTLNSEAAKKKKNRLKFLVREFFFAFESDHKIRDMAKAQRESMNGAKEPKKKESL
jgi:hypothetical protein